MLPPICSVQAPRCLRRGCESRKSRCPLRCMNTGCQPAKPGYRRRLPPACLAPAAPCARAPFRWRAGRAPPSFRTSGRGNMQACSSHTQRSPAPSQHFTPAGASQDRTPAQAGGQGSRGPCGIQCGPGFFFLEAQQGLGRGQRGCTRTPGPHNWPASQEAEQHRLAGWQARCRECGCENIDNSRGGFLGGVSWGNTGRSAGGEVWTTCRDNDTSRGRQRWRASRRGKGRGKGPGCRSQPSAAAERSLA